MAAHESPRTTKLCDRTRERLTHPVGGGLAFRLKIGYNRYCATAAWSRSPPHRNLQLTATSRASMQRQELHVKGARGDAKELAELPVPGKYRWVPEGVAPDSRYNVAQLYARLAERIGKDKPVNPGFDAAVTRHRLLDAIVRASETGTKQVLQSELK
jgi:hypothetical protein